MKRYRPYTGNVNMDLVSPYPHDPIFLEMLGELVDIAEETEGKGLQRVMNFKNEYTRINGMFQLYCQGMGEYHGNMASLWPALCKRYELRKLIGDKDLMGVCNI